MTDNKKKPKDSKVEEPKGGRPGPVDEGGSGGMATREVTPELVHRDGEDNDD
ncbi:hypothetical protein [Williamsia sp. DF01-3]|uniref:hypothetical protein n=1 Tax=Williamsia sp. DF01-3 TaxID=2934157 RepID=UPI001FF3EB18|nr:hypothetical protein [Williamsia sp. DF01-3]MCK0518800.1 hypothetical protein [Williamsia sp. DF01-3]